MEYVKDQRISKLGAGSLRRHGLGQRQSPQQDRQRDKKARYRPGDAYVEQRLARTDRRLDANQGAEGSDQRGRGNEVRQRRIDSVFSARMKCPNSCANRIANSVKENGMPIARRDGRCTDPVDRKQRQRKRVGRKGRQIVDEVVLQSERPRPAWLTASAPEVEGEANNAVAVRKRHTHLGIDRHLEGVGARWRGIRHR